MTERRPKHLGHIIAVARLDSESNQYLCRCVILDPKRIPKRYEHCSSCCSCSCCYKIFNSPRLCHYATSKLHI